MRISELSAQTGVTVPTIKYYLREGLLPEGERSSPTQAAYGEKHVERLRVIRALLDAGVSIAETRRVLGALDDPPANPHELLGTAHAAITPSVEESVDLAEAEALVEGLGWKPGMCDEAVLHAVARALDGLERAGFVVPKAVMREYLRSARRIADAEIAGVPGESAEAAVRYVVLGSVLVEPLLLALRRVAQQVSSGERFNQNRIAP
ncbi:MerR family transcriptional regulator [Microbacterium sp. SSW1-47]|uniref:MerR family transcriptional regulator n=1 Tax=Microbacterium sufflavum TaxID=2851649 RepID=UPI001FFD117D|nr:MerR family transcriptional regulator [Microbacterium sufflavum]MCK2025949.1 MerR family transcriptional regulator [Microbacterium sufflavum]